MSTSPTSRSPSSVATVEREDDKDFHHIGPEQDWLNSEEFLDAIADSLERGAGQLGRADLKNRPISLMGDFASAHWPGHAGSTSMKLVISSSDGASNIGT